MIRVCYVLLLLTFVNTKAIQSTSKEEESPREYWLAIAYANGIGVVEDKSLAAEYFHEAAKMGHAASQRNLGIMMGLGDGIPKDSVEAYAWLKIATVNRDSVAREALKDLERNINASTVKLGNERAIEIIKSFVSRKKIYH